MKAKILTALKNEYANLGFSKEALNGIAESLASSGNVKDENLDAVIKGLKPMLTSLQSERDAKVTASQTKANSDLEALAQSLGYENWAEMKAAKKPEPAKVDTTSVQPRVPGEGTEDLAALISAGVAAAMKPIQENFTKLQSSFAQMQVAKTKETAFTNVQRRLREKYEAEKQYNEKIAKKAFAFATKGLGDDVKEDDLYAAYEADYEDRLSDIGTPFVPGKGDPDKAGSKPDFSAITAKLQAEKKAAEEAGK